jgi:hypothetical protein
MQNLAVGKSDASLNGATVAQFTTDIVGLGTDADENYMHSISMTQ